MHSIRFRTSPLDRDSAEYISQQPAWQQERLREWVEELRTTRAIQHADARPLAGDRWSLWVRDANGENATNHICYLARADEPILSDVARAILNPEIPLPIPAAPPARRLMIVNTWSSAAVATGQAEAYLTPEYYGSLMDDIRRAVFTRTIDDIQHGRRTDDYSLNTDGSYAIHIDRPDLAYGVHIHCVATWVT
jgi:hypothetical protein